MRKCISPILICWVFLLAIPATASTAEDRNVSEIKAMITTYSGLLQRGDVEGILALYSADPVFMPEYAPAAVGRDAVRKAYEWVFATLKLNGEFHFDEIEIHGDFAWARTHSTGKFTVITTGVESDVANNEFFLFKRERGKWKVHRYLFNANAPLSSQVPK